MLEVDLVDEVDTPEVEVDECVAGCDLDRAMEAASRTL